jgi:methyl-accepting chemotaxis protein
MKNLSIARKLVASFGLMIGIMLVIGVMGIIGMALLNQAQTSMYTLRVIPVESVSTMFDELANQRITLSNSIIFNEQIPDFASGERAALTEEKEPNFEAATAEAKKAFADVPNALTAIANMESLYYGAFASAKQAVLNAQDAEDTAGIITAMKDVDDNASAVSDYISELLTINNDGANGDLESANTLFYTMLAVIALLIAVSVLVAVLLGMYINKLIGTPIKRISFMSNQVGEKGDLTFDEKFKAQVREDAKNKDEVGDTSRNFMKLIHTIEAVAVELNRQADGDFRHEYKPISDRDVLGIALQKMSNSMNTAIAEIEEAAANVEKGSAQISEGANNLSDGSTSQAATTEQLAASLGEVSMHATESNTMAEKAAQLSDSALGNAEIGSKHMDEMLQAVREINEASEAIQRVTKVIADIAFQTNILALNAAVEAARAGEAGKGFSVVADEVRNLASKSGDAAKETESLIDNSMKKAQFGAHIASETSASLSEIVSGINQTTAVVRDIARSSEQQRLQIAEITEGVSRVSDMVQETSATAEESAATSDELTAQAESLKKLVDRFKIR